MAGVLQPLESGRLIAETSKDVKVNDEGVSKVAKFMYDCIRKKEYSIKSWKEHELNPKVNILLLQIKLFNILDSTYPILGIITYSL